MLEAHAPKHGQAAQSGSSLCQAGDADGFEEENDLGISVLESQRRALERRLRASEQRRRELETENLQLQLQLRTANTAACSHSSSSTSPSTCGSAGHSNNGPRPRGATQAAQTPATGAQRVGRLRAPPASPPRAAGHSSAPDAATAALKSRQASSPGRPLRRPVPKSSAAGPRTSPCTPGSAGSRASPERCGVGAGTAGTAAEASNGDEPSSRGDAPWKFSASPSATDVEAPSKTKVGPGRGLVWPSPSATARIPPLALDRAAELAATTTGSATEDPPAAVATEPARRGRRGAESPPRSASGRPSGSPGGIATKASGSHPTRVGQQRRKGEEASAPARRRSPLASTAAAPARRVPSPAGRTSPSPARRVSPSPTRRPTVRPSSVQCRTGFPPQRLPLQLMRAAELGSEAWGNRNPLHQPPCCRGPLCHRHLFDLVCAHGTQQYTGF